MPRLETVITPPVRGASRTLDMSYPSPQFKAIGTADGGGIQWINRQGVTTWDMGTITGFGAPPAGSGWDVYRGRMSYKQTGNGASGGFFRTDSTFDMYFPQTVASIGGNYQDDYRCWRVLAILAFDTSALGVGDIGIEVQPNGNYDVITGANAGYRIGPTAANAISVQVRQNSGGALTIDQATLVTDVADWHAYEMRFIGATGQRDGVFKALIDGVPVGQFSYGPGTLLPSWAAGTSLGYQIGVGNRGAAATFIASGGLQVAASATESGLL